MLPLIISHSCGNSEGVISSDLLRNLPPYEYSPVFESMQEPIIMESIDYFSFIKAAVVTKVSIAFESSFVSSLSQR